MRPPRRRALVAALVGVGLLAAACGDGAGPEEVSAPSSTIGTGSTPTTAPPPEGDPDPEPASSATPETTEVATPLPPLSANDPAFDDDACRLVETYYRHLTIVLTVERPRAELEAMLDERLDLLHRIENRPPDDVPDLAAAIAVTEIFHQRVIERWGSDGRELLDELDRIGARLFYHVMAEPVVVDGRQLTGDEFDADDQLTLVDDALVLACTTPPPDWALLTDDPELALPDLAFLSGDTTASWPRFDLAEGRQGQPTVTNMLALELSPDGNQLVGSLWPNRELYLIDPLTWESTPVPEAGLGWACPSWSVDGRSILGDLVDPVTGERSPVRYQLDAPPGPQPLPDSVGSCPKALGGGEVTDGADDVLVAVAPDGTERELLAIEHCNLVPVTRPKNGLLDVYANCRNPYLDGLHVVDMTTGDSRLAIAGRVAAGDVSPDGRWRVFGYTPFDRPTEDIVLWVLDQETGRARSLDLAQYYPIFTPVDSPDR